MSSPIATDRHTHRAAPLILVGCAIAMSAFHELLWRDLQAAMAGSVHGINQEILRLYFRY
ncbi:MAG: hypothetical protein NXI04_05265 [Planctomycetaceae bacterium]|nr:hypothetical protein [Planctomycetaceae bacterium]